MLKLSGFTILEAIVAITIMAIVAAIVVPVSISSVEKVQVASALAVMRAVARGDTVFKTNVTQSPGRISQLGTQILTTDTSSCSGIAPSASAVTFGGNNTKWANAPPYFHRAVSKAGGLPIGIGVINDQMLRTTANNVAGTLDMVVPNVRLEDADAINDLADGTVEANNADLSNGLGIIRWAAPDNANLVVLRYRVGVNNSC